MFNNPTGIAQDAAGNTYVADTSNNIIRKIDTACNVTTIAGILPRNSTGANVGDANAEGIDALSAVLNQPTGIAVDPSGTVIVYSDIGSNRIRKITNGTVTTIAGCVATRLTPTSGFAQNCNLTSDGLPATLVKLNLSGGTTQNTKRFAGVAMDSKGVIYFTEPGNQVVRKLNLDGTLTTIAGQYGTAGNGGDGGPAVAMFLSNPTGIAVDNTGVVFVADTANFAAHIITKDGIALALAGQPGASADNKGNVFLADTSNNKIDRIPYATPAACFDAKGCPANSTPFADYRVAGNLSNTAGDFVFDYSAPASATAAASTVQLSFPTGVYVDSKGNVWFTDSANNLIREAVAPAPSK
jgi:trimeric autotransporter adhesin